MLPPERARVPDTPTPAPALLADTDNVSSDIPLYLANAPSPFLLRFLKRDIDNTSTGSGEGIAAKSESQISPPPLSRFETDARVVSSVPGTEAHKEKKMCKNFSDLLDAPDRGLTMATVGRRGDERWLRHRHRSRHRYWIRHYRCGYRTWIRQHWNRRRRLRTNGNCRPW